MARSGPLTILLITAERLVRADIRTGRGAPACQIYRETRPVVDDLPSLVEEAIHLGPKKLSRVLLLCSDFWTQTLPLAAETAVGMSEAELPQALAFEAEPFSGISAFDSLGSSVTLPVEDGERQFWFTQVMASIREQVEYTVQQAGGKLIGVAHPSGTPQVLDADMPDGARWQRVELWPEVIVHLDGEPDGTLHVHVVNSSPQAGFWQQDAEAWFARFDPPDARETLCATDRVSPSDIPTATGDRVIDLDEDAALEYWLATWAGQLAARAPSVPLIRPAPKPMPNSTRFAIAGLLGAVVLLLCAGHHWWARSMTEQAEQQFAEVKRPADELKKVEDQAKKLDSQLAAVKKQADTIRVDLATCRKALGSQRERLARLLTTLAESSSDEFVIQAIEGQRDGLQVRGICLRPEQANRLVQSMDEQLREFGLRVHLPKKEAQYMLADGGPYVFELLIQDAVDLTKASLEGSDTGSMDADKRVSKPVAKPSVTSDLPKA